MPLAGEVRKLDGCQPAKAAVRMFDALLGRTPVRVNRRVLGERRELVCVDAAMWTFSFCTDQKQGAPLLPFNVPFVIGP